MVVEAEAEALLVQVVEQVVLVAVQALAVEEAVMLYHLELEV